MRECGERGKYSSWRKMPPHGADGRGECRPSGWAHSSRPPAVCTHSSQNESPEKMGRREANVSHWTCVLKFGEWAAAHVLGPGPSLDLRGKVCTHG